VDEGGLLQVGSNPMKTAKPYTLVQTEGEWLLLAVWKSYCLGCDHIYKSLTRSYRLPLTFRGNKDTPSPEASPTLAGQPWCSLVGY
jgi:hypothetical protein